MAGRIEASKVIRPFDGEGDVVAWLAKVELVASLTETKDVAKLVPLYLEGGALALYLEMNAAKRADYNLLSQELMRAYSDSEFVAYSKLRTMKWTGEAVDVFANDIRKLARGCGLKGDGLEQVVKLAFITGFPDHIAVELQQIQDVEKMSVSDVLKRARILASNSGSGSVAAPAIGRSGQGIKCFGCGGPHVVRNCPNPEKREKKEVRCYRCGGGHIVKYCPHDEIGSGDKKKSRGAERENEVSCVTGIFKEIVRSKWSGVPVIDIRINGKSAKALVDTGCTRTMVREGLTGRATGETVLAAFDGREVKCKGSAHAEMSVGEETVSQEVMVMDWIVGGIDAVIGMDTISRLGGVKVQEKLVQFGNMCAIACGEKGNARIRELKKHDEDADRLQCLEEKVCMLDLTNQDLKNKLAEAQDFVVINSGPAQGSLVDELSASSRWGQAKPHSNSPVSGESDKESGDESPKKMVKKLKRQLSFLEEQKNGKIAGLQERLADMGENEVKLSETLAEMEMTERELKAKLALYESSEVTVEKMLKCQDKIHELRTSQESLLDQLETMEPEEESLQERLEETERRLKGKIVTLEVEMKNLKQKELKENGLVAKESEALEGGAVLGLKLRKANDGQLKFEHANTIPEVSQGLTRKELFSICGKLVGHYPKAGWLRVACSYVKRHAEGDSWDDYVGDGIRDRMKEIVEEVRKNDPVKGMWRVPKSDSGAVWCDASELVMGVVLEIGGTEVEDASWMRKEECNRKKCDELEVANGQFNEKFTQMETDKREVVAFWKRQVEAKTDEIADLNDRHTGLQQTRDNEREQYELQIQQQRNEYQEMKDQLTSENMILRGKLAALEEFKVQKEDLMAKFAIMEEELKKKDQDHKENIYNLEKKAVMSAPPAEEGDCGDGRVQIGEEVWVRPGGARCTTRWGRGIVTGVNSVNNIEVDGVPCHILDVRPVVEEVPEGLTANVEDEIRRYPRRDRHAPTWMRDYVSE